MNTGQDYKTYLYLSYIWNLIIFVFFSYVVFFMGGSGWWYFFMIMISASSKTKHQFDVGESQSRDM